MPVDVPRQHGARPLRGPPGRQQHETFQVGVVPSGHDLGDARLTATTQGNCHQYDAFPPGIRQQVDDIPIGGPDTGAETAEPDGGRRVQQQVETSGRGVDQDEPADTAGTLTQQQPVPTAGIAVDVADGQRLTRGEVLAAPGFGVDEQGVGHTRPDRLTERDRGAVRCPSAEGGGAHRAGVHGGASTGTRIRGVGRTQDNRCRGCGRDFP